MTANVVEILVKATDGTKAGFDESKASAEGAAGGMDAYAAAVDKASASEAEFRAAQAEAAAAAARLEELQQSGSASADELAAAQDRLTTATLASMDAQVRLASADAQVALAAKGAGDAAEGQAAKADASGGAMAAMGGKVKMALLGVAVGMGLAVKGAADFQQQTVKLTTSAGESTQALASVQQGILSLSAQTATSTTELASGMYMIESAGFHGAAGLTVLKAAAQGAKAEGADLREVANAVTSGLNAYGMKASQATAFTNEMVAAVGAGKMTMQDLAGSLSAVLPVAASAHISFAQVGGAIATMTSQGMSAQQAAQDLAFAIRGLLAPNAVASKEMAAFGISSVDVATHLGQRGLTGTIGMLAEAITSKMGPSGTVILSTFNQSRAAAADANTMLKALPPSIQGIARAYLDGTVTQKQWTAAIKGMPAIVANQAKEFATTAKSAHAFNDLLRTGSPAAQTFAQALAKMTGGATGLNVALMLTGSHAATFSRNVAAVGAGAKHAGSDVTGWNDITKETSFQMSKAGDSIKAAGISLGMALLPAVNAVLGPLSSMLAVVAGNKAASIALATIVGGLLAGAIGVKMAGALKDMSAGIKAAGEGATWLVGKIVAMTAAQEAQTVATEAGAVAQTELDVAEDANPIGLIILAIVALIAAIVLLATHWKQVWHAITSMVDVAVKFIRDHWKPIVAWLIDPMGMVVYEIRKHWTTIKHDFLAAIDWVIGLVKNHWQLILAILEGPVGLAVYWIREHWAMVRHDTAAFIDDVVHFFERLPGRILAQLKALPGQMLATGKNVILGLIHGIESAAAAIPGIMHQLASDVSSYFTDPLKLFSPSRVFFEHGRNIVRGADLGAQAEAPALMRTMSRIAGGVAGAGLGRPGSGGYGYGAAGGGVQRFVFEFRASDGDFMNAIMKGTRVLGGDPRMYQAKVVLA